MTEEEFNTLQTLRMKEKLFKELDIDQYSLKEEVIQLSNLVNCLFAENAQLNEQVTELKIKNQNQTELLNTLKRGIKTQQVSYSYPEPSELSLGIVLNLSELYDEFEQVDNWLKDMPNFEIKDWGTIND